jgi:hypothetical protein
VTWHSPSSALLLNRVFATVINGAQANLGIPPLDPNAAIVIMGLIGLDGGQGGETEKLVRGIRVGRALTFCQPKLF